MCCERSRVPERAQLSIKGTYSICLLRSCFTCFRVSRLHFETSLDLLLRGLILSALMIASFSGGKDDIFFTSCCMQMLFYGSDRVMLGVFEHFSVHNYVLCESGWRLVPLVSNRLLVGLVSLLAGTCSMLNQRIPLQCPRKWRLPYIQHSLSSILIQGNTALSPGSCISCPSFCRPLFSNSGVVFCK